MRNYICCLVVGEIIHMFFIYWIASFDKCRTFAIFSLQYSHHRNKKHIYYQPTFWIVRRVILGPTKANGQYTTWWWSWISISIRSSFSQIFVFLHYFYHYYITICSDFRPIIWEESVLTSPSAPKVFLKWLADFYVNSSLLFACNDSHDFIGPTCFTRSTSHLLHSATIGNLDSQLYCQLEMVLSTVCGKFFCNGD